jgi:hypothetical protein
LGFVAGVAELMLAASNLQSTQSSMKLAQLLVAGSGRGGGGERGRLRLFKGGRSSSSSSSGGGSSSKLYINSSEFGRKLVILNQVKVVETPLLLKGWVDFLL